MKKVLILLIFMVFATSVIYSQPQWVLAGNVSQPGLTPSVSMCNSTVGWIVGGTGTPKIFKTTNGGLSWQIVPTAGITQELNCVAAFDENTAFVGEGVVNGGARLFKTTNGGTNWTVVLTTGNNNGFFNGIQFAKQSGNIYGVAVAQKVYRTSNSGQNWVEYNAGVNGVSCAHNSVMIVDNNFYGFGLDNGAARIRLTADNSVNWNTYQLNITGSYTSSVSFHTGKLLGLSATSTSLPTVSRTTDGGLTWTGINVGTGITGNCIINWVPQSPVVYVMGENGGIKRSTDNGLTWVAMTTSGATSLKHFDFFRLSNIVYGYAVSSSGSVIKLTDTLSILTAIGSNNTIPAGFELKQNYPNPFNPETKIRFEMPKSENVTLKVFDATGRLAAVLVNNEPQSAGLKEITFNGNGLTSGIYFYTINIGEFKETKKMLLIK